MTERQLSSREQLIEAINEYLDELAEYKKIEKTYELAGRGLQLAGKELERVYFDQVSGHHGQIIVKDKNGRPIMIELGRSGRVYPKIVEIETYIEL